MIPAAPIAMNTSPAPKSCGLLTRIIQLPPSNDLIRPQIRHDYNNGGEGRQQLHVLGTREICRWATACSTATRPTGFPHLRAGFNDKLDRPHAAVLRGASLAECEETKAETTSSG